jgi:ParB family chromosome partitioning protein
MQKGAEIMNLEQTVLQVHIEDIIPNRFQPRLSFDEQGLQELAASIKEHGIIQPLVLRKLGDKFEIIAGERRYKAAQMAGLSTVPAVIANIDDNKSAEVALVENVQRRDLTAIEEARSYKNLLDKGYLTQEQLAKRMGISQPAIANKLRLLNLDEEVQQALLEEKISERHARTLLTLPDKNAQKEWLHKIINERLTVRQLDMEIKKLKDGEDLVDIPLVEASPSIEEIKANAVDINDINKPKPEPEVEELEMLDVDNSVEQQEQEQPEPVVQQEVPFQPEPPLPEEPQMQPEPPFQVNQQPEFQPVQEEPTMMQQPDLQPWEQEQPEPSIPTFNMDEKSTINADNGTFTTATTVPEFNIAEPHSASTFINESSVDMANDSKFFNMNNLPPEEPRQPEPQFQAPEPRTMEVFDSQATANSGFTDMSPSGNEPQMNPFSPFNNNPQPQKPQLMPDQPMDPNPMGPPPMNPNMMGNNLMGGFNNNYIESNPNNKFFTGVQQVQDIPLIERKEETMVNPMDVVASMDPNFKSPSETQSGETYDLKYAIDTMRNTIDGLGSKGFYIDVEEIDFLDNYQITMKIHKDN